MLTQKDLQDINELIKRQIQESIANLRKLEDIHRKELRTYV